MKRTRIAVLNNHDNGEGDGEVIQMLRRRQALRRRQRELMVSRAYVKDDDERGHARLWGRQRWARWAITERRFLNTIANTFNNGGTMRARQARQERCIQMSNLVSELKYVCNSRWARTSPWDRDIIFESWTPLVWETLQVTAHHFSHAFRKQYQTYKWPLNDVGLAGPHTLARHAMYVWMNGCIAAGWSGSSHSGDFIR